MRWCGASSASSPGRHDRAGGPGAGGPLSAGAGIPPGGALSAGAGIPPAGGSFCARATEAKPDRTSRAAHSGRVMDVSGLGVVVSARDYTHDGSSFREAAPHASSGTTRGSDVLLCGNVPRSPGNHFENRDLQQPAEGDRVSSTTNKVPRDAAFVAARAITSAAISCWTASATAGWRRSFAPSRRAWKGSSASSSSSASAPTNPTRRTSCRCSARRRASRRCSITRTSRRSTTSVTIDGAYFMVMEHLVGDDLSAVMRALRARDGAMPPSVAVYVAREVARALHYAHTLRLPDGTPGGVVHRDVTPSNVMLLEGGRREDSRLRHREGGGWPARPADGGRPRLAGKLAYLSPELVRGAGGRSPLGHLLARHRAVGDGRGAAPVHGRERRSRRCRTC